MCTDCGCEPAQHNHHDHDHGHSHGHGHHEHEHDAGAKTIRIEEDILGKNNRLAAGNRELFSEKGLFVLNLVSSPGMPNRPTLIGFICSSALV
jgi:hydrogenase nickel incorporation protein HypB